MPISSAKIALDQFTTFGDMLRYLRRRAGLTQRELSIAVGYSDAQISRLEQNERPHVRLPRHGGRAPGPPGGVRHDAATLFVGRSGSGPVPKSSRRIS